MKFKMNGYDWVIEYKTTEELKKELNKEDDKEYYCYGLTVFSKQRIYINEEVSKQRQRHTLYHELMHCYIGSYINDEMLSFDEEALCNISAKSHDIINNIANDFFETVSKKEVK